MKKLNLFVLALVWVSGGALAASAGPAALEAIDVPLSLNGEPGEVIRVSPDGEVQGGTCMMQPGSQRLAPIEIDYADCQWDNVGFLTQAEVKKMTGLIEDARRGVIEYPKKDQIYCLAVPVRSLELKADNGTVLLKSGSYPCGKQTYNKSAAAEELVNLINQLRARYVTGS